jgi:protein phosphatase
MAKLTKTSHQHELISRGWRTDRGLQRNQNEDACALPPAGADEANFGTLLVVADGVGSLAGGAEASWDAVHYLQALYYAETGPEHPGERLRECVEGVNILNRAAQQWSGQLGERLTTLVAAVIYNDDIWVANVGDSRAYLVQAETGQRRQLTEDHSLGADLDDDPEWAADQAGAITQAIGMEEHCQVDIYRYQWQPGDRLILCSDGLASLSASLMAEFALQSPPQAAAERLVAQANKEDGSDNSTVVVIGRERAPISVSEPEEIEFQAARSRPGWRTILLFVMGLILGWLTNIISIII